MDRLISSFNLLEWDSTLISISFLIVALIAGVVSYWTLSFFFSRLSRRIESPWSTILFGRLRGPVRILVPLLALMLVSPSLAFSARTHEFIQHLFSICFIAVIAWLGCEATLAGRDIILGRFDVGVRDNLKARVIHTQLTVLVRIVLVIGIVIAGAGILMTFDKIRQVGMSILASAGILGIIIGFAAQRSLATLIAGLQIALTQPIRLDDVVIVEGEYGVIEELTLTYVVIRVWDLRRLVVPVTYFLEKPFQNLTRLSANLLGTVFLYVDYMLPVDELRRALHDILSSSDNWDGKVGELQVTNAGERTIELRALMSAADASTAWNLRCEVRERLLAFIRENHPDYLPRVRAELERVVER
ncbi:MAG TPA: mechanosensitive ion channel domain-containing protein [Geobacteraceae bacterium]|nr:mechanosensitive ion channel domain-containing protein [Geobacteraceae bacterium]